MENRYTTGFSFSQDDVIKFAELTGDKNPVHLDKKYAGETIFKRPIMHGFLSASIFSRILGMEFPGEGTIYLKQSLKFLKPMYVDEEYTAKVELIEKLGRGRARLLTEIFNKNGEITIEGEAVVINKIFDEDN